MQKYLFTRARLAEGLLEAGCEVEPAVNLYNPQRPAWKVVLTSASAAIIADYYGQIGRVPPSVVKTFLDEGGAANG